MEDAISQLLDVSERPCPVECEFSKIATSAYYSSCMRNGSDSLKGRGALK